MKNNESNYSIELRDDNILLIKFKDNFIISKLIIDSIFDIIKKDFYNYPLIMDISNISGVDYDAIDVKNIDAIKNYPSKIALIYSPDNISKRYANLISNLNSGEIDIHKFTGISEASKWTNR